jgi:hypothetical protein
MELRAGPVIPTAIYIGGTAVKEVRWGSSLLWRPAGVFADFGALPDAAVLPAPWINETFASLYDAGIVGGTLRLSVPSDVTALPLQDSRFRHTLTLPDDGYLEVKVGAKGAGGIWTQAFRRYDGGGTFTGGVGIHLQGSALYIVARYSSSDVFLIPCGAFVDDDVLRLKQAGQLHTMSRNGAVVGTWNDTSHLAHVGVGFRSVGVHVQGATPIFSTVKVYSPSLRYIHAE